MGGFYNIFLAFNVMTCLALYTDLVGILNRNQNEELNRMTHSITYEHKPDSNISTAVGKKTHHRFCCGFYYDGCTEYTHDVSIDWNMDNYITVKRPSTKGNDSPKECCAVCYKAAEEISLLLKDIVDNAPEVGDATYFVVIESKDRPQNHYILCSTNTDEFILISVEVGGEEKLYMPSDEPIQIHAWTAFIKMPFSIKSVSIAELSTELEKSVGEAENSTILKTTKPITVEQEFKFGNSESPSKQDQTDKYEYTGEEAVPGG